MLVISQCNMDTCSGCSAAIDYIELQFQAVSSLSLLGRDLHEAHLQVVLGGSGYRSSSTTSTTAANDPFLSSLALNYPTYEAEEISKSVLSIVEDATTKNVTSQLIWKLSFDPSLSAEE